MIDWLTASILASAAFLTVATICATIIACLHMSQKRRAQDEAEDFDEVQKDALAAKEAVEEMLPRLIAVENRASAIAGIVNKVNPRVKV